MSLSPLSPRNASRKIIPVQENDDESEKSVELDNRIPASPSRIARSPHRETFSYEDYKKILRADSRHDTQQHDIVSGETSRQTHAQSKKFHLIDVLPSSHPVKDHINMVASKESYISIIRNRIDAMMDIIETRRLIIKRFLSTHTLGLLYIYFMLSLSIISTIQYIFQTYYDPSLQAGEHADHHQSPQIAQDFEAFQQVEKILASIFLFDWTLFFFLADHKMKYMFSFFSMVDLLSIVPIWITSAVTCPSSREVYNMRNFVVYIICGLKTTRVLRWLRIHRFLITIEDQVKRAVLELMLVISGIILFNSAMIQYLEAEEQSLPFHTWAYFIWVTVATVGYGDVTASTILGRFFAMFTIGFTIVVIPKMTNDLIEKMRHESIYQRIHYQPKVGASSHVLICGDLSSVFLEEFFAELFHEDHDDDDNSTLHAVVLQSNPPSHEMLRILRHPVYSFVITYIEGSALSSHDLFRAKASSATSVLLLSNKFSISPDEEDAKTILMHIAIKRLLATNPRHSALICVQLIREENRRHLNLGGDNNSKGSLLSDIINQHSNHHKASSSHHNNDDHDSIRTQHDDLVICINHMKMGVIAKSVIFPGTGTLLMNLLTSFSDDHDESGEVIDEPYNKATVTAIDTLDDDALDTWLGEYRRGCEWEVYTTLLSDIFEGARFALLAETLYDKLGVLLLAIEVEDIRRADRVNCAKRLMINPGNYIIPSKDECRIIAFVLAKTNSRSDLSFASPLPTDPSHVHNERLQLSLLTGSIAPALRAAKSKIYDNLLPLPSSSPSSLKHSTVKPSFSPPPSPGKRLPNQTSWKMLKSSSSTSGARDANNRNTHAEAQQLAADEMLQQAYYLRSSSSKNHSSSLQLDDITVPSVLETLPDISDHIIVIAKSNASIFELLMPLRAKTCASLRYIVLLCPDRLSPRDWRRVSQIQGLVIVQGSGLEERDIRRAGIYRASSIIILADPSSSASSSSSYGGNNSYVPVAAAMAITNEALIDADAIFTYQCVRRLNDKARVVVEIIRQSNVRYLAEAGASGGGYSFSPLFAAGMLFTSQLLDSLVCQAFHNPRIVGLVDQLIIPAMTPSSSSSSPGSHSPSKHPQNQSSSYHHIISSSLYQISLPDDLEGRTYGALFKYLASKDIIPLALYRGVFPQLQVGPKGNHLPFVFTNPDKDTELYSCDRVFVLSQTPLIVDNQKENEDIIAHMHNFEQQARTKSNVHHNQHHMHRHTTTSASFRSTPRSNRLSGNRTSGSNINVADDTANSSSSIYDELRELKTQQTSLEALMKQLSGKIDDVLHKDTTTSSPSSSSHHMIDGDRSPSTTLSARTTSRSTLNELGSGGYRAARDHVPSAPTSTSTRNSNTHAAPSLSLKQPSSTSSSLPPYPTSSTPKT